MRNSPLSVTTTGETAVELVGVTFLLVLGVMEFLVSVFSTCHVGA